MKCVFIVYNQANTERVEYMLDELGIRATARWVCGPLSGISSRQCDFLSTIFDFGYLCAFI